MTLAALSTVQALPGAGLLPAPQPPAGSTPAAGADPAAAGSAPSAEAQEAARELEGVFLGMLVEEMMKGTGADLGSPVHSGMITEGLTDALVDGGGLGLADVLARQLAREEAGTS